ncbi:MAG: hypothetical protein QOG87_2760 [Actinomycetota bacterium]|jgi:GT2 family glycosyltransferase
MTDVRIGIVSWNTAELLGRCLDALPAATGALTTEVVVVDNDSSDGSAEVAAAAGVGVVRNATNVGYAKAMNQALADTDAEFLLALNPDTEPPPGSLERLVDGLRDRPDAGLAVPRLVNVDGSTQHSVYRFPSLAVAAAVTLLPVRMHAGPVGRRFWLEGHAPHDRTTEVEWAIGAVHCIRRAALDGEAPYRERWFMYVEDLDLCWRLSGRGWKVVLDADVEVPHVGNAAGAQAWGAERTARWLDPTYDWYALERGETAARRWAAVNVLGVALKLIVASGAVALRVPPVGPRRAWAGELRQWLRFHGHKLVHGPHAPLVGLAPRRRR